MNDLVGTWRLLEVRAQDANGEPMPPSYGPVPIGMVMFHPGGRMVCALCDGRVALPVDSAAREYVSYGGAYTYDGKTLVTRVDITSDARRMGGDEVRQVRFDGERLVLTPPPREWYGKTQSRELIWERLA